jgi:hypothetical protein
MNVRRQAVVFEVIAIALAAILLTVVIVVSLRPHGSVTVVHQTTAEPSASVEDSGGGPTPPPEPAVGTAQVTQAQVAQPFATETAVAPTVTVPPVVTAPPATQVATAPPPPPAPPTESAAPPPPPAPQADAAPPAPTQVQMYLWGPPPGPRPPGPVVGAGTLQPEGLNPEAGAGSPFSTEGPTTSGLPY